MQKKSAVDIELSCDESVIQDADYAVQKAYTETLLSTLHKQRIRFYQRGFKEEMMRKRFNKILARKGKRNGAVVLICAIIIAVNFGTLESCSITKENTEESGLSGTEDIPVESIQTNEPSQDTSNNSFGAEHSNSDYATEMTNSSAADTETQTVPFASAEDGMQNTGSENDLIFDNPILLEDYYNTPDGKAAIEADFEDLAGDGMSVAVSVIMDEIVVTVKYEDSALLTEGIKETLAQQLDAMTDRFWMQMMAYDEFITWRCVLTVRYTDPEGNVLAEQSYSAE